jgi:DNA-binding NtrC family response regulator
MARVSLHINDLANRLTLKTLLEADGHSIVLSDAEVAVYDQPEPAAEAAQTTPTLLLAHGHIPESAVRAMAHGVLNLIHLPLMPGEATLLVRRVAAQSGPGSNGGGEASTVDWPTMDQVEREHILHTIQHCRSNYTRAARILGIGRNTLWRKLNRYRAEGHLPPADPPLE